MDLDFGNGSPGLSNGESRDQVNEDCRLHFTAQQSLKRSAALFLLALKDRYQLTQSALDFTVSQVKEMMFYDHQDKVAAINTALGSQPAASTLTQDELGGCLEYKNPFAALETEHLQTKYYREHFGLVVSSVQYHNLWCFFREGGVFMSLRFHAVLMAATLSYVCM